MECCLECCLPQRKECKLAPEHWWLVSMQAPSIPMLAEGAASNQHLSYSQQIATPEGHLMYPECQVGQLYLCIAAHVRHPSCRGERTAFP